VKITSVSLYRMEIPLTHPYYTAIAHIPAYMTVIALLQSDGKITAGESTPLLGYSWESPAKVWEFVKAKGKELVGKDSREAYDSLTSYQSCSPFSTTPLLTALEAMDPSWSTLPAGLKGEVPLVGILNVRHQEEIPEYLSRLFEEGYETIKIKVGFQVEEDIQKVKKAQELVGRRALIRIDANQGYSFEEAQQFVGSVDPGNIELFEQPFPHDQWDTMRGFAPHSPLPLMLDESIYNERDIQKARDWGCAHFIKLKLMKAGSMQRLIEMGRKVIESGFKLVIGNGISTDVGCYHEALVFLRLQLKTAGELNGFLKVKSSLFQTPLQVQRGKILLKAAQSFQVDMEKIERFTVEKAEWRVGHRRKTEKGQGIKSCIPKKSRKENRNG